MTARYRVEVLPAHEREEQIKTLRISSPEEQRFHYFRQSETKLPVIRAPIGLPIYRLENYRTRDEHLSRIAQGKNPTGFFDSARQEDEDVQQAQHDLLIDFARRGKGEDIVPIWDELEGHPEQTEHLLITSNGVVVNGNRRLCAMRELYQGGDVQYAKFQYVNCMVLPESVTGNEIIEMEIRLQMVPDTKLPYTWTTIGRAARDLRNMGRTKAQIEEVMKLDWKVAEREINKLEYAELYLTEWMKKPDDYSLLEQTQQAFTQVAIKNPANNKSQTEREVTRSFDFFLIENRDSIEDRAYDYINIIEGNANKFFEQFAHMSGTSLARPATANDDDLEIDLGATAAGTNKDYQSLVDMLVRARGNKERYTELLGQISSICDAIGEQKKNKGGAALKFAKQSFQKLENIDLSTAAKETLGELQEVLNNIVDRAQSLSGSIEKKKL